MKGKRINLKIVLMMILILSSCFCLAMPFMPKNKTNSVVEAASTKVELDEEDYSALFGGDIVFSAEKVLVNSSNDFTQDLSGSKQFLANYTETSETEFYNFKDTPTQKTVIDNGEFVKLDNIPKAGSEDQFSVNGDNSIQEAIMISFGAYVYNGDKVNIAKDDNAGKAEVHAGISRLEVTATRNGQTFTVNNNRNIRTTDEGLYFDFAQLITQTKNNSNEGHYVFNFDYMVDFKEYSATFSFYIVNNTSYTAVLKTSFGYQAQPTVGWVGTDNFEHGASIIDGYYRYFIGKNGILSDEVSYPTITYDYTKYELSYTHTANERNTTYSYKTNYKVSGNEQNAELIATIKDRDGTRTKPYAMNDYEKGETNLVTIMLTEPGTYVVDYVYLYNGETSTPLKDLGFDTVTHRLAIHGQASYYSKTNYEGAKTQYYTLATKKSNQVDLIVPNGYNVEEDISSLKNTKLGFCYELKESDSREGNVLSSSSFDALINNQLQTKFNAGEYLDKTYLDVLTDSGLATGSSYNIFNLEDCGNDTAKRDRVNNASTILDSIKYVQTNQGSLWLEGNDKYTQNSYYFYSPTRINKFSFFKQTAGSDTENELDDIYAPADPVMDNNGTPDDDRDDFEVPFKKTLTNTTSFNQKGYYLVFLNVNPNGIIADAEDEQEDDYYYWQVFAFQYTSSSVDINVEEIDGANFNPIANGKFTNKEVRISWKKPGVFDRAIQPYYYSMAKNTTKEELLSQTENTLTFEETVVVENEGTANEIKHYYQTATLGNNIEVQPGTFKKFLIKLESEGESATYKTFTIDKQDISGIKLHIVEAKYSGNNLYYAFTYNRDQVYNSITDGPTTLMWNEKDSGAKTYARYSYTPFIVTNENSSQFNVDNQTSWITTNYALGETISGSDLNKSSSVYNVPSDCILFNQGIYIVEIWDDAGNKTYYSFIIDNTENYVKVNDIFVKNTSLIYGTDVTFSIGTHKAFQLTTSDTNLKNIIENSANGNPVLMENYYSGNGNNIVALRNLFTKFSGKYYLTVKNNGIRAYDNTGIYDGSITVDSLGKGELEYIESASGSYERTIHIDSENHKYSANNFYDKNYKNWSYVAIEINKDNARGTVYYSDSVISTSTIGNCEKLSVGSDRFNDDKSIKFNGIDGARATSAKNIAFTWNVGAGTYEVKQVSYEIYSLNYSSFDEDATDGTRYFYTNKIDGGDIYKDGVSNGAEIYSDGTENKGLYVFNGNVESKDGLYIVTRTYASESADFGEDSYSLNYYFIVDRNKIIDIGVGRDIKLILMEETNGVFNNFSTTSSGVPLTFSNNEDGIKGANYNIYLSTTKIPAEFSIPTGKYFGSNGSSARYHAGRLNVSIYFDDTYDLLPKGNKEDTLKIYSSYSEDGKTVNEIYSKDIFNIDIYNYIKAKYAGQSNLINALTESETNKTWLILPGRYIVRITDNVENVTVDGKQYHEKYIGLQIEKPSGPTIEIFNGYSNKDMFEVKTDDYKASVSQEFVKVVLPSYNTEEKRRAQVDPNYIVITEIYENGTRTRDYLNHPYLPAGGININEETENGFEYVTFEKDEEENRIAINIWLNTRLRDSEGNIIEDNLGKLLEFEVKVRYKLNNLEEYNSDNKNKFEMFMNCYQYTDFENGNEVVKFYESTYTIKIDRLAPEKNITELNTTDRLVQEYNQEFGTESMLKNDWFDTNSNVYFTKNYDKYYSEKKNNNNNIGYAYVYNVSGSTTFYAEDVEKVYIKEIGNLASLKGYQLTLPLIDSTAYSSIINAPNEDTKFGSLGYSFRDEVYYEIVEMDAAGNATQYIILYNSSESITLNFIGKNTDAQATNISISTTESTTSEIHLFEISAGSASSTDANVKIVLTKNGAEVLTILTKATTEFSSLTDSIVNKIKKSGFGTYELSVSTKNTTAKSTIVMYDSENLKSLTTQRLVKNESGEYHLIKGKKVIDLNAANFIDSETEILYYAQKITIKQGDYSTDYLANRKGKDVTYNSNGAEIRYIEITEGVTYYISLVDMLENSPSPYRFNTSIEEFIVVEFEDNFDDADKDYYLIDQDKNHYYYGFTQATFKYDSTIYGAEGSVKVEKKERGVYVNFDHELKNEISYKVIELGISENDVVEYRITLTVDGVVEGIYYITIDTRLSQVVLSDSLNGDILPSENYLPKYYNIDYESSFENPNIGPQMTYPGRVNLNWEQMEESDYFDYVYNLYELMEDGTYNTPNIEGKYNFNIFTKENSTGKYRFEIAVYSKDGAFLGNKIHAFEVSASTSGTSYSVWDETVEVKDNAELKVVFEGGVYKIEDTPVVGNENNNFLSGINTNIPLKTYVTNKDLRVEVVGGVDVTRTQKTIFNDEDEDYSLTLHKIHKENAFTIFIAILKINEMSNIVKNVKVNVDGTEVFDISTNTSIVAASQNKNAEIVVSATDARDIDPEDTLLAKNKLMLEVRYNGSLVNTVPFNNAYSIVGNGQYSFVFRDLAGNAHEFVADADGDVPETEDTLDVFVLREVVVTLNGNVPIPNGYYNDQVSLAVYGASRYVTGSITIESKLNGQEYKPSGTNPYIYQGYGTFRVVITAKYKQGDETIQLSKVINFSILNVKEARTSIDLSNLKGCEFETVLNNEGKDVTTQFIEMVNSKGYNISYENVLDYSNEKASEGLEGLGVTSGKATFTLTYKLVDGIYPERKVMVAFTLNNEIPTIHCTLKQGETTKKGFTIYFNGAIVYEQIGEAYVYINDEMVYHINDTSSNSEQRIKRTFKSNGDGDYYVKLVSTSGVVLDNYKVTIKEPLNVWAVIVIIVIVAVVATVTVTIIVLRRKMRIR